MKGKNRSRLTFAILIALSTVSSLSLLPETQTAPVSVTKQGTNMALNLEPSSVKINTSLTIAVPSAPLGKLFSSECTIEATLKDENGNPLQNFDIDYLYACVDHTHLLGTAKTDSNGVASLKYTFPTGTNNVKAMFSGTPNYASSSSEYIEIIIIDYAPYIVGGGLITVAIIGVVGYVVFRTRREIKI